MLGWPTTLPDGTWLNRAELQLLRSKLWASDGRPVVLLGAPGSGKSALLARLSSELVTEGVHVIAVKADRLPATIKSLRDLREYLEFPLPVASAILSLSRTTRTVLVIDQLDALADLVDVKTERLSVVLKLIGSVAGGHNVQVVCSAREFDYRHDVRFDRLSCEELTLELPAVKEVDQVLSSAGYAPDKVPQSLKEVLRSPYALKSLLSLKLTEECDLPTTWCALMEKVWSEKFLSRSEDARSCEATLRALAAKMAQRRVVGTARPRIRVRRDCELAGLSGGFEARRARYENRLRAPVAV